MIEFRLHEGRTQYRTWVVEVHIADGTMLLQFGYCGNGGRGVLWTDWENMPVSPGNPHAPDTDNKNWRDFDKTLTPYRAMFCKHEEVHISAERSFCAKCNAEL